MRVEVVWLLLCFDACLSVRPTTDAFALSSLVSAHPSLGAVGEDVRQLVAVSGNATALKIVAELDRDCDRGQCNQRLPSPFPAVLCLIVTAIVLLEFLLGAAFGVGICDFMVRRVFSSCTDVAPAERSPYIDNAKFLLQTLVVLSAVCTRQGTHSVHSLAKTGDILWPVYLTNWSRSFVIPMFAFLSGFVAKSLVSPEKVRKIVSYVFVPYLLLNTFVMTIDRREGSVWRGYFPTPWVMARDELWYLLALAGWHLITGVLQSLFSARGTLIVSYLISWASGYWHYTGNGIVMVQTFGLLCFFTTGVYTPTSAVQLCSRRAAYCGLLLTICILGLHFQAASMIRVEDITSQVNHQGSVTTASTVAAFWPWSIMTLSRYAYFPNSFKARTDLALYFMAWTQRLTCQFLVIWPTGLAFLAMVPQHRTFFTELGRRSLYCYVLHPLILDWCTYSRLQSLVLQHGYGVGLNVFILVAFCVNVLLSSTLTQRWAKFAIEPTWLEDVWQIPQATEAKTVTSQAPANN